MRKINKKLAVIAAGTALAVGGAGVAYAYWTTTGAGSSDGVTAGTSNGTVTLSATFDAGITPGGSKTVTLKGANPGTTDLRVGTVHLSSVSITKATGNTGDCATSDFTMPDVTVNETVPAGTLTTAPKTFATSGTLSFANDASNSQDGCKGATITLGLTSN